MDGDPPWNFQDITRDVGPTWQFSFLTGHADTRDYMTGGLAPADIDGSGYVDLYIPQGDYLPGRLLRNLGNGQFEDVSEPWNLVIAGGANEMSYASGAAFADVTGNGFPDLILGGVREFGLRLFLNDGSTFQEATESWGLGQELQESYSVAFADINANGYLDMAVGHWDNREPEGSKGGHLWLNTGSSFVDVSDQWGISGAFADTDYSFTPNFGDLTGNGRPDLVIAADFDTSQVFHNIDGTGYQNVTTAVISDENGMGAALGDIDNDGHLDWFVSSIHDPDSDASWGTSGNRLYLNDGTGDFQDHTESSGVREGGWGWGSCMADFNNNGHLDIFHVNGWNPHVSPFQNQPARLFVNQGDGTFVEQGEELGVADTGQGRGIVCFDFDRDGDVDIFIQNNAGEGRVYRNNASEGENHWLGIKLSAPLPNTRAVGARIIAIAADLVQTREMSIPNHYLSTSPAEIHLGLGAHPAVDQLEVRWPDGQVSVWRNLPSKQWITLNHPIVDEIFSDRFQAELPEQQY